MAITIKKIRSPNYPAISLPDAIERLRKIYSKAHTHKIDSATMAQAAGYGGLNGAALSMLSALKKYGLLEEVGNDRKVNTMALTILSDPATSEDRKSAIQKAAFAPSLFNEIRKQFPDSIPADEIVRSYLLKKTFSPSTVDVAIKSFRETMNLVTEEGLGYSEKFIGLDADVMLEELVRQPSISTGMKMAERAVSPPVVKGDLTAVRLTEVGTYPVAKNCMVRLLATGPLTETAVKTLIKHLQMGIDVGIYPDSENETA